MSNSPVKENFGKKLLIEGVAVFLILVFCLAVGEGAVRLIASQKLIYNIEMVKYAKSLKMPDPDQVASHVHRPNSSAHLMGVNIALNSLGNRGPELPRKSPNVLRIMVLGSSVTMGWGVSQEETFTSLAEKKLNTEPLLLGKKVEIVNAGI